MTATFTRTRGTVGKSTTTGVGIRQTNPSRTGKAQRIINNEREANLINNGHPKRATITIPMRIPLLVPVAMIDPVEAAPRDQISTLKGKTWIARLRTDRVAIFQASASKAFKAAASIVLAAEEVSGVTASAAAEDLVVAALADSAAADSGADDEDSTWNFPILFLEKLKPQHN
jgi:hypothetical protein